MINSVVIHCSDSKWGCLDVINDWHEKRSVTSKWIKPASNGVWCLYHIVICNGYMYGSKKYNPEFDGHVQYARPIGEKSNHAGNGNRINRIPTVGIVMIGESGGFSDVQMYALTQEIVKLQPKSAHQHSEFDPARRAHCAGLSKHDMNALNLICDAKE